DDPRQVTGRERGIGAFRIEREIDEDRARLAPERVLELRRDPRADLEPGGVLPVPRNALPDSLGAHAGVRELGRAGRVDVPVAGGQRARGEGGHEHDAERSEPLHAASWKCRRSASTTALAVYSRGVTCTGQPCARAASAVTGPMHAIT